MRVLHCISTLGSGGAERQVAILARTQQRRGAEVHVAFLRGGQHLAPLEAAGVVLHPLSARGHHDPRIFIQVWALLGHISPDVMHSWLPMMDVAAGAAAHLRRTAWVMAERSADANYANRFKDRVLRAGVARWADAVVANSEGGRRMWAGQTASGARTHVVRNALPLTEIDAVAPALLAPLGIASDRPVVIFVGRLAPEKNIELLLELATTLCSREEAQVVVCGDGPMRPRLEAAAASPALRRGLHVLGVRSDVWALIKASNVFVSTSRHEGQPNAVLESMACGCPLVVSEIASHREFLDDGTAEFARLERDPFLRAIRRTLAEPPVAASRARAARAAATAYAPEVIAEQYAQVYGEAIRRQQRCAAS